MRIDTRKSLTLVDPTITPAANLLNPEWRKSFQQAMQILKRASAAGGVSTAALPFQPKTLEVSPDAKAALDSDIRLRRARDGRDVRRFPTDLDSRRTAEYAYRQYQRVADQAGAYVPPFEDIPAAKSGRAPIYGTAAGDLAGNAAAALLAGVAPRTAAVFNQAAPFLGGLIGGWSSPTYVSLGHPANDPEMRAQALINEAEIARHTGSNASAAVRDWYALPRDALRGYRQYPRPMSDAESNAVIAPGMGWSAALGVGSRAFPLVAGVLGSGFGAAGSYMGASHVQSINRENEAWNAAHPDAPQRPLYPVPGAGALVADAASAAAEPAAAWAAARAVMAGLPKSVSPLAGAARMSPAAALAYNAVRGAKQLYDAYQNPELISERIAESAGTDPGFFTIAGRTLAGDPIGAAVAASSDARQAGERQVFIDQALAAEAHRRIRESFEAAPSVSPSILAQLVGRQVREDPMQYMQWRTANPEIARAARMEADAVAAQNGWQRDDPRTVDYARNRAHQAARKQSGQFGGNYALTPEQGAAAGQRLAEVLSQKWGIQLTEHARAELSNLARVIGPYAATRAFIPTGDAEQDTLKLQAILNPNWVDPSVYNRRATILGEFSRVP